MGHERISQSGQIAFAQLQNVGSAFRMYRLCREEMGLGVAAAASARIAAVGGEETVAHRPGDGGALEFGEVSVGIGLGRLEVGVLVGGWGGLEYDVECFEDAWEFLLGRCAGGAGVGGGGCGEA